jgi:replicative DNA helicase
MKNNNNKTEKTEQTGQELTTISLPTDSRLETDVLGALLIDSQAYQNMSELLFEELFFYGQNKMIFAGIRNVAINRKPIDLITVAYAMKSLGTLDVVGGPYALSSLTEKVASAANLEFWIRILQQLWLRRKIIEMGVKLTTKAQEEKQDIFDLLSEIQVHAIQAEKLLSAANGGERLIDVLTELEDTFDMTESQLAQHRFPIGIGPLDKLLNDLRPGELFVIAGIPGSGKTSLAINMAANIVFKFQKAVSVISYEMTKRELVCRVLSDLAEVDSKKIGRQVLEEDEKLRLEHATNRVRQCSHLLQIDDRVGHLNADGLRNRIRSLVLQSKVEMVIIDYLQIMPHCADSKGKQTSDQISDTCAKLKDIAKEMNIPIILLSQLNRESMKQAYGRPKMSHLLSSGGIEANADRVLLVWRPDYIGYPEVTDNEGTMIDTRGKVCVIQAKFRHGETGEVWLRFTNKYTRFESLDNYSIEEGGTDVNWGNLNTRYGSPPTIHNNNGGEGHYSDLAPF